MLTAKDYEIAKSIIKDLELPEEMGCDDDSDEFNQDIIYDAVREAGINFGSYVVANGVSKAVIIPANYNFVIKIPLTGRWFYPEEYNEETEEWGYQEDPIFEQFTGAEYGDGGCDYCDDETHRIGIAEGEGFGRMFPHTDWLGQSHGKNFYIQEKVYPSYGFTPAVSEESRKRSASLDCHYQYGNETWRAAIIEQYGEEFWTRFCEWDNEIGGTMRDMHSGNYGYTMNGEPVIFDASGFDC